MKIKFAVTIWVVLLLTVSSCRDNTPLEPEPPMFTPPGVFTVNEGNFTTGNASLTWFRFADSTLLPDAFYAVNKVPLGDVANYIAYHNGRGYVVVNNSGIVYVIDIKTGAFIGKISGLSSPREILFVDDNTALISDLFDKSLTIADLSTFAVKGKIDLNGHTSESMVKAEHKVFVANWSKMNQQAINDKILVVDIDLMKLTDSIAVTVEPNSMAIDKNNKLWVLCSGGFNNEYYPALYRINTESNTVEKKLEFSHKDCSPVALSINGDGDKLFYLNKDIYRISVSSGAIPEAPFVACGDKNFYALGVRPDKEEIFVSDALDYVRNGQVYVYDNSGNLRSSFEAGIIPGYFGFVTE